MIFRGLGQTMQLLLLLVLAVVRIVVLGHVQGIAEGTELDVM